MELQRDQRVGRADVNILGGLEGEEGEGGGVSGAWVLTEVVSLRGCRTAATPMPLNPSSPSSLRSQDVFRASLIRHLIPDDSSLVTGSSDLLGHFWSCLM